MVDGQTPACAQACPTTSIKYGEREEMVGAAKQRVAELHAQGLTEARLYGANETTGSVAPARSSCCSTSPRSTGCRRIRGCPPPTCRGCSSGRDRCGRHARRRRRWPSWRRPPLTVSEFDSFRPPEPAPAVAGGEASGGAPDGATARGEMPMVPEPEFTSYYGRPVVKPPPWGHDDRRLPVPGRRGRRLGAAADSAASSPGGRRCAATPGWRPGGGRASAPLRW